ncbi:MAG: hypothetical protein ACI9WC_000519 [Arenicella sp.]|jgi:hypothetical protein
MGFDVLIDYRDKGLMRLISNFSVVALLLAVLCQTAIAKEDWSKWRTYENKYFRIHSDAKEKKVLSLLEELETFRLVVRKAIKVKVPLNAEKTNVLLFRKKKEFRTYSWHRNLAGFVTTIDSLPIIVMPASRRGMKSETVIKHEYVHIAQAYDKKKYPRWWNEGLAEILSTVEYHEDIAVVGKANVKRWQYLSREVNYNKLVKDDYDGLKRRWGADSYAQYWLLAIYSLVHDDGVYRDELGDYIVKYRASGDSLESFTAAYGRSPDAFAKEAMRNFGRKAYSYKPLLYQLDLAERDLLPVVNALNVSAVNRYFEVLSNRKEERKNTAKRKKNSQY